MAEAHAMTSAGPEVPRRGKVAYFVNLYPAVSHTFIRREILALERQGIEVLRMALRAAPAIDAQDAREHERTRYVLAGGVSGLVWALFRTAMHSPLRLGRAVVMALRMARRSERPWPIHLAYVAEACVVADWLRAEVGVQHLHAHFATNPAEIALLVHLLTGTPYSFTAHGSDIMDRPAQIGLPETVGHAAFVVAVCAYGRSQICKWVPHCLWPRIRVIRCGLDPDYGARFAGSPSASATTLVCVGRLSSEKGQLVLLDAARLLRDRGSSFEVVLVGDGPMRPALEARVAEYGLAAQVRLAGAMDAEGVRSAILRSRAMVLSSLSEGLPVVIMEAMALGRPVIAPYLAGIPELVSQGVTGWLYPAGDAEALAAAIERCLAADAGVLAGMAAAAREAVAAAHDVDREAAKLAACFAGPTDRVRSAQ